MLWERLDQMDNDKCTDALPLPLPNNTRELAHLLSYIDPFLRWLDARQQWRDQRLRQTRFMYKKKQAGEPHGIPQESLIMDDPEIWKAPSLPEEIFLYLPFDSAAHDEAIEELKSLNQDCNAFSGKTELSPREAETLFHNTTRARLVLRRLFMPYRRLRMAIQQSLGELDTAVKSQPCATESTPQNLAAKSDEPVCYVTLQQCAAIVNRSKRTLERYLKEMPKPAIKGKRGQPDEWLWRDVRPFLEEKFKRTLPAVFPADRFAG
jgi:hypothetical protein